MDGGFSRVALEDFSAVATGYLGLLLSSVMPPLTFFMWGGLHGEGVFSTFSVRGSSLIMVG